MPSAPLSLPVLQPCFCSTELPPASTPAVILWALFFLGWCHFTVRLLWTPQERVYFCYVPHSTQHGAGHTVVAQQTLPSDTFMHPHGA